MTLELFKLLAPVLTKALSHFEDVKQFCKRKSQGSIASIICSMQGGILDLSLAHVADVELEAYEKHLKKSVGVLQKATAERSKACFLDAGAS